VSDEDKRKKYEAEQAARLVALTTDPDWWKAHCIETETTTCPFCGKPVVSYWVSGGGGCLSRPEEYLLIADWILHSKCWDTQVEEYEAKQKDETEK
jgi:hypothetical protein